MKVWVALEDTADRTAHPAARGTAVKSALFDEYVRATDGTAHSPVILHAPHGGRVIPKRFRSAFVVSDAELDAELDALTDHFTDRLVASVIGSSPVPASQALREVPASAVINGLSRFVVDVERFDDETEEMRAAGMGVLYTHGSQGQRIRDLDDLETPPLMAFYSAYSDTMRALTDAAIEKHGCAVIIDVHSYPRRALPYELHADEHRPELCVGFEQPHASDELLAAVAAVFSDFEMRPNGPFHGAYVPLAHYRADARVQAVMLEIRRDCYMDESRLVVDEEAFTAVREALGRLVASVAALQA
jgi:N-formylglutamate amidohydrolase